MTARVPSRRSSRAGPVGLLGSMTVMALAAGGALPGDGPTPLQAQSVGPQEADTLVLTLDDALRIAGAHNPDYRQAVNDLGLNDAETRATWANQILPSARLRLFDTQYTGNVQRIGVDDFGNPVAKPDADWFFRSSTSQSLSLNWSIQGSSIADAFRSQQLTNRERLLSVDVARAALTFDVRRRYYEVLEQRAEVELEQSLADARALELELARQLFALAANSRVDVLQAELAVEQQGLAVQQRRNEYERTKLALRTALGDDGLGPFRLSDEPLPIFDPGGLDADALARQAEDVNPEVLRARSAVESERVGVRRVKNRWWPDLSVSYDVYRRKQEQETEGLFDVPFDQELEQNFRVSLGVPFFNDFFGNRRDIERAEVAHDNARERLRQARLRTAESVRAALLGLRNQYESLRLARRSLEIAGEALGLAREEYRLGTRTFGELQQSVQDEADARRQVTTARFGFVDALLDLEEAVGAPVRGPGAGPETGAGTAG